MTIDHTDADNFLSNARDREWEKLSLRKINEVIENTKVGKDILRREISKDLEERLRSPEGLKIVDGDRLWFLNKLLPAGYNFRFNKKADTLWIGDSVRLWNVKDNTEDDVLFLIKKKKDEGEKIWEDTNKDIEAEESPQIIGGIYKWDEWNTFYLQDGQSVSAIAIAEWKKVTNWNKEFNFKALKPGSEIQFDNESWKVLFLDNEWVTHNLWDFDVSGKIESNIWETDSVNDNEENDTSKKQDASTDEKSTTKPGIKFNILKDVNWSSIIDNNKQNKYSSILSNSTTIWNPNKSFIDDEINRLIKDWKEIQGDADESNIVDMTWANSIFASTDINPVIENNNDSMATLDYIINNPDAATWETTNNGEPEDNAANQENQEVAAQVKEAELEPVVNKNENLLLKIWKGLVWDWTLKHVWDFPKNFMTVLKWSWGKLSWWNKKVMTEEKKPLVEQTPVVEEIENNTEPTVDDTVSETQVEEPVVDKTETLPDPEEIDTADQPVQENNPPGLNQNQPSNLNIKANQEEESGKSITNTAPAYSGDSDELPDNPKATLPPSYGKDELPDNPKATLPVEEPKAIPPVLGASSIQAQPKLNKTPPVLLEEEEEELHDNPDAT